MTCDIYVFESPDGRLYVTRAFPDQIDMWTGFEGDEPGSMLVTLERIAADLEDRPSINPEHARPPRWTLIAQRTRRDIVISHRDMRAAGRRWAGLPPRE